MEPTHVLSELLSRLLSRALTALLNRGDVTAAEESAWSRGVRDTRQWVRSKPVALAFLCGLVPTAAAALAAVLTARSPAAVQVLAGVGGFAAGFVLALAGLLIAQCAAAPIRQRDEARAQLASSTPDELEQLANDFDAFVVAENATRPSSGVRIFRATMGMARGDRNRVLAEHNAEYDRALRAMLGRYHESFRARVLQELEAHGREVLLRAHGDIARDPRFPSDIERLGRVVRRLARVRAERPDDLELGTAEERSTLARDLKFVATEVEEAEQEQTRTAQQLARELPERNSGVAATPGDRTAYGQQVEREQRRDRCNEVLDRAHAMGAIHQEERRRSTGPDADLTSIAPRLRELATDLDGNAR